MKTNFILSLIAISLFTFSCKKDLDSDTTAAKDYVLTERALNDGLIAADEAATLGNVNSFKASCVDSITYDTTSTPKSISIYFGDDGNPCNDGRIRKGTLHVGFNGKYKEAGTDITITYDKYIYSGHEVNGTRNVSNKGNNSSNQPYFTVNDDVTVKKADNGGTITWTSTRTRTYLEGYETSDFDDDVITITGSGAGTTSGGDDFTMNIKKALRIELSCQYIVSGVIELIPEGKLTRAIDYGNGVCDANATVMINNVSFPVRLDN